MKRKPIDSKATKKAEALLMKKLKVLLKGLKALKRELKKIELPE